MKKKIFFITIIVVCIGVVLGFATNGGPGEETVKFQNVTKAIKVTSLSEEEYPVTLDYIGIVKSRDIINYSFKSSGRVGNVHVDKGDKVKPGDTLIELDINDLKFQLDAAKSQLDTAKLSIDKAEDAYNYNKDQFKKIESLYNEGSASKVDFDRSKLNVDTSKTSLDQSVTQYNTAKIDYDYKNSLIKDAKIYASEEGTIVEVPFNEGELIGSGHPAAIVRSQGQIIEVGVAPNDIDKVKLGLGVSIDIAGRLTSGKITKIAEAPDTNSMTYTIEVSIEDQSFRLGQIAKAKIRIGSKSGLWLPISSIMSDGEDYVFVVSKDRVFKRVVVLQDLYDNKVLIEGLENGELVVTSGMKSISDGSLVNIVE